MQMFFHQSVKGTEEKNTVNVTHYPEKYSSYDALAMADRARERHGP
jgi:hypothetical protein